MTSLSVVSRKDLLAIVTVADIAIHGRDHVVRATDIASRHNSGTRYFEPMLHLLARSGILQGRRGRSGGYQLARDPQLISIVDIIRVVRGAERDSDAPRAEGQSAIELVVYSKLESALAGLPETSLNITIQDLVQSAEELGADLRAPSHQRRAGSQPTGRSSSARRKQRNPSRAH
jgi:Rrf2 family protein